MAKMRSAGGWTVELITLQYDGAPAQVLQVKTPGGYLAVGSGVGDAFGSGWGGMGLFADVAQVQAVMPAAEFASLR